ncbi:hypothetical protein [Porphyrobacter sp. YT40]|uniref:hypothetical protein n=1 Tax=Porphyrobacter sp. YT40 TaxID=2547601 RepID=UPI001144E410|nr:hypothetical protein [Porphyrobacter sp. YT40]QDH35848.1 hypothetical protein E2E27_16905 [Porphyrobacter sp. YT40]
MNWWEDLHLALSAVLFVIVWIEGDDEPFLTRTGMAALIALFWLPLLIIAAIWLAGDWVGDKLKGRGE